MSQRNFAVMGDNIFKIAERISSNQRVCRLLKYQVRNPFSEEFKDVDGLDLLHKQILITPKIFDATTEKMSYLVSVFDSFEKNPGNQEFKISGVRFVIACPYDEWVLDSTSLRPYLLMEEIDKMFNRAKLSGIGTLKFQNADLLTLSPQLGGYTMRYVIDEFN